MLQTRLDNIPADVPYIKPLTNHYLSIPFIPDKPWKIGIVWGSKSSHFTANKRSCQLTDFANLAKIPQVQLYSLQKGEQVKDLQDTDWVINLDPVIRDFTDTASIIDQLDLVITVDTAVAHLAGAMGKPVWLLLSVGADWRWLDANTLPAYQEYSPWYPTMRLFRQTQSQDWSEVFARLAISLQEFTATAKKVLSAQELSTLAQEYQKAGNIAQAIAHYQQAIMSDQNYLAAYNNLGNLYRNCGQIEQAIEYLQRAVQLQPAMPEIHNNLASAYQDQGDFTKAISHFQQAIELKPAEVIYRQNLAMVFHNMGQIAESIEMYRSIINLEPNNAEIHRLLGMNLLLTGNFVEGFAEYEWRWQTEKTKSQAQLFE
ncbi:MAG: tetratricopeptide repeat protein, partial [Microcoleaceae cyanobacterium]